mmetsp:Transcript_38040/g.107463  ORF Transcript_38040/g.107463 Transcript_38040/m.107463 type:complete len:236 (+) Transcript_38040:1219-1926(+)
MLAASFCFTSALSRRFSSDRMVRSSGPSVCMRLLLSFSRPCWRSLSLQSLAVLCDLSFTSLSYVDRSSWTFFSSTLISFSAGVILVSFLPPMSTRCFFSSRFSFFSISTVSRFCCIVHCEVSKCARRSPSRSMYFWRSCSRSSSPVYTLALRPLRGRALRPLRGLPGTPLCGRGLPLAGRVAEPVPGLLWCRPLPVYATLWAESLPSGLPQPPLVGFCSIVIYLGCQLVPVRPGS